MRSAVPAIRAPTSRSWIGTMARAATSGSRRAAPRSPPWQNPAVLRSARSIALLLAASALAPAARAQDLGPYHVAGLRDRRTIEVKLREAGLGPLPDLFARAVEHRPLVEAPFQVLDDLHRRALAALPEGATRPGHLGSWHVLRCGDDDSALELLADLLRDPAVEDAYLSPVLVLASAAKATTRVDDLPPPTPDLSWAQTYKGVPPLGFAFEAARSVLGARGEDVTFYHLEDDWIYTHEDLDSLGTHSFLGVIPPTTSPAANHGTGVLGVTLATRNAYGMTGVADRARGRLVSWALNGGIVNSIQMAVADGRAGDVITIVGGYNLQLTKPDDHVPAEYFQSNFDVIRTATALGFLFVEAAMNGDNDLDDPRFSRRFDLSARDSGAMMVGASAGSALTRATFSNFGSRIDTNGWGGEVATTGYGDLLMLANDRRQAYSQGYAGTSSATALAAAVVTSLASAVERQRGTVLTPLELRALLRAHGTTTLGDIGTRADLVAMLRSLGLPDGLEVDRHEVALGTSVTLTMRGPAGGAFALALAAGNAVVPLGLNRPLHLDLATMLTLGGFGLPGGVVATTLAVPNDPSLRGLDVFFQGLAVDPSSGPPHVSSCVAIWLR